MNLPFLFHIAIQYRNIETSLDLYQLSPGNSYALKKERQN